MISRRQSTIRKATEQLREASFTANSGINITSPVTERNSVFNATNFDVALDGSLTLRKPLIVADNKIYTDANPILIKHLYLKDYKLYVYKTQQDNTYAMVRPDFPIRPPHPVPKFEKLCLVYDGEQVSIELGIVTDINGKEYSFNVSEFLKNGIVDTLNATVINTPSSTLISGILLDVDYFSSLDLGIKLNENNVVPRYLQLYKNELDTWVLKVITQLPNEIASDTIRLNPNTALDYPYAIRDNYSSEAISVSNILAYVHCEKVNDKLVYGDGVNAHGAITTVEELTENGNIPGYLPVTSVEGNEPYIYLKAFLNIKNTPEISYVCLWEKTFDGVTWVEVPEFISKIKNGDLLSLQVPTDMLQESLNTSEKTVKKTFAKFHVTNQKDLIVNRYDILPLSKADGATYRFTIYTLPQTVTYEILNMAYSSTKSTIVYGEDKLQSNRKVVNGELCTYNIFKADSTKHKLQFTFGFTAVSKFPDIVNEDFSAKLITKEGTSHDVTVTMNSADAKTCYLELSTPTTYGIETDEVLSSHQFAIQIYYKQIHYFTLKIFMNIAYDDTTVTEEYVPDVVPIVTQHSSFDNQESLPKMSNLQDCLNTSGYYDDCSANYLYKIAFNYIYLRRDHVDIVSYIQSVLGSTDDTYYMYIWNSVLDYLIYNDIATNVPRDAQAEVTNYISPKTYLLNNSPMHMQVSLFEHSTSFNFSTSPTTSSLEALPNHMDNWIYYICREKNLKLPTKFDYMETKKPIDDFCLTVTNALKDATARFKGNVPNIEDDEDTYASEGFFFIKTSAGKIIIAPVTYQNATQAFSSENLLKLKETSSDYNINEFDTVFNLNVNSPAYAPETLNSDTYTTLLARAQYSFIKSKLEPLTYEFSNSVLGNKLYYKKSIYSFGDSGFKNNIFVSEADSFNTPLFNIVDLDASGDSIVTTLIPWRDYLLAATEHSIYLITKVEDGFLTKTVNTFIGIPAQDSRTCKSILNGIIFKSGSKIYILQPSMYSGDDTILNISEVSKPINNYIVNNTYDNFAFTTEDAYYLFMPEYSQTTCLKYEYSRKLWTKYVYPIRFINYDILSVNDIRLYTSVGKEYYFNKTLKEVYPDLSKDVLDNIPYGDYIGLTYEDIANFENLDTEGDFRTGRMSPIQYYLDSGQKTDAISYTKQFTESKIILATLHQKDKFPFTLTVKIDGKSQPVTVGVHTDSALWKDENADINTLSTNYASDDSDLFNVLRQMFVRYSAKGKSLQHIILGESYFNFKLYVVYYRYKLLNFKQ